MKADCAATTLEHGRAQTVVEQHPGDASHRLEGGNVATQEVVHALVEIKPQEALTAEVQHC